MCTTIPPTELPFRIPPMVVGKFIIIVLSRFTFFPRTIEMMYKHIGDAIQQAGLGSHPTDWLLFLCPGKREAPGPWMDQLEPPMDPAATIMRRTMRGPIYVHSKMLIVDDCYIIVGSANINQVISTITSKYSF